MAEPSAVSHPTRGRRRKYKGPAQQPQLPDLPPISAGDDSSDTLEDEKEVERPRSTSTTPKSGSGLEPHECDRLMGLTQLDPVLKMGLGKKVSPE